uniref:Uncharacterized protein n=1 Tax=Arundo donax TaxID=35708 RepID=A0A0A8YFG0_ARUDO
MLCNTKKSPYNFNKFHHSYFTHFREPILNKSLCTTSLMRTMNKLPGQNCTFRYQRLFLRVLITNSFSR